MATAESAETSQWSYIKGRLICLSCCYKVVILGVEGIVRHLHGEHGAHEGATPPGGSVLRGDGGRQGVVTTNAKSEEETPDAQLANHPAGQ